MESAQSFIARIALLTGGLTPAQIPDEPLGVVGCILARSPHGWLRGVDPLLVWETNTETQENYQTTVYMRWVISERGPDLPAWDGVSRGLTGVGDPVGLDTLEERAARHGRWMVLTDGDCSEVSASECAMLNRISTPGSIYAYERDAGVAMRSWHHAQRAPDLISYSPSITGVKSFGRI